MEKKCIQINTSTEIHSTKSVKSGFKVADFISVCRNFKEGKGTFSCERGVAGKICTARETTKQFPNPAFYANKNNGTFISELSFLRYNTLNPMNYFSLFILIFSLQLGYQGTRGSWQAPWQPMAAGSAQLNLIPRKAAPLRYQQYVMR